MKSEISILINSGIELTEGAFSINGEIETRKNTSRKINRSIEDIAHGYSNETNFQNFSLNTLYYMKRENDACLQQLYDLKKQHSPYKNIVPRVSDKYEIGAILYDTWGYEQTNIDFYCIVNRSGQFVTVLPMVKESKTDPEKWQKHMSTEETPLEIDFTADPIKKKVKSFRLDGKEDGFSLRNYAGGGWCNLWEGDAKTATHYA